MEVFQALGNVPVASGGCCCLQTEDRFCFAGLKGESCWEGNTLVSLFLASRRTEYVVFNAQIVIWEKKKVLLPEPALHDWLVQSACTHPAARGVLTNQASKTLHSNAETVGCNKGSPTWGFGMKLSKAATGPASLAINTTGRVGPLLRFLCVGLELQVARSAPFGYSHSIVAGSPSFPSWAELLVESHCSVSVLRMCLGQMGKMPSHYPEKVHVWYLCALNVELNLVCPQYSSIPVLPPVVVMGHAPSSQVPGNYIQQILFPFHRCFRFSQSLVEHSLHPSFLNAKSPAFATLSFVINQRLSL